MDAKEMQKKIEENEKFSRYLNGFLERLDQRITDQSKNITRIERLSEKNSELLQDLIAKTKNGWGETLARHDRDIESKVEENDFNAAMKSVREMIDVKIDGVKGMVSSLKWSIVIAATLLSAVIGAGFYFGAH